MITLTNLSTATSLTLKGITMKHLILGSAGQIGSHLVSFLNENNVETISFDLENSNYEDLRIYNNTYLEKCIEESDFVYFLAFDVGGSRYLKTYQKTFTFLDNNVKLMENTFEILHKYKKPFIFTSSQMSNMDYSPYGTLKRLGEYYTSALNGVTVKFWNVYGIEHDENKSHVITDFIKKAIIDKKIDMLTDGQEERQFLFADDCSECLYTLSQMYDDLERDKEYHITNFEWAKIIDVAKIIQSNIDCEINPSKEIDTVQLNKRNIPDPFILKYWQPKTSLKDGIKLMCQYYQKHL
jgi:nucleoside-diphosphate-sugar epimerase